MRYELKVNRNKLIAEKLPVGDSERYVGAAV